MAAAANNPAGTRLVQLLLNLGNTLSPLPPTSIPASLSFLRSVHVSVYDKNIDEQLQVPSIVPDYVIPPQPNHYWAPHPVTGVFGPVKDHIPTSPTDHPINSREDSVLEQETFFRHLEDKPIQ